jgi:hypothetical protein
VSDANQDTLKCLVKSLLKCLESLDIDGASVMKILTSSDPVGSFAEWALLNDYGGDRGIGIARDIFIVSGVAPEEARSRVAALEQKHWPNARTTS